MKLKIEINMDNDAFKPHFETEVARLFQEFAFHISKGSLLHFGFPVIFVDINGNKVGVAKVIK